MSEPLEKYQERDAEVVDYGYVALEGCSFAVRGPLHRQAGLKKIACLGSAATFGRYVQHPYPEQLGGKLGASVINLGFGGARFETYLKEPATLSLCRESDLVVVELMSARSYPSHLFRPFDHLTGKGAISDELAIKLRQSHPRSPLLRKRVFVDAVHEWAVKNLGATELENIRSELLTAYRDDAIRLVHEIGRPVLLLWFSQRSMDRRSKIHSRNAWDGGFPHFVGRETVEAIRAHAIGLVEVVSKAGIPSKLVSRFTGRAVDVSGGTMPHLNNYYPSAEMHEDAALKLSNFVAAYWRGAAPHAGETPGIERGADDV